MKRYLRTGIRLSRETREAWELAGFQVTNVSNEWPGALVINYGSRAPLFCGDDAIVLNLPSRIERTRVEELPKYVGEYMPVVQLDGSFIVKGNGSKGKNKLLVVDGSAVTVQRFLHPAEEFRVVTWDIPGVMHPEVLAWSRKVIDDPMNPASYKDFQYLPTYEVPPFLNHTLLVAHQKLGLNFVGWDVLLHEGKWWVIEANSAPGVGEQTARRIRKRLRKVFAPAVAA